MMVTTYPSHQSPPSRVAAGALALRLAHAEHALRMITGGEVDAIVSPDGKTYLLQPAQEEVREKQKWLQAVIESTVDGIMVVNRGGAILSQNQRVSRVLGYKPDELLGTSIFQIVGEEDLPAIHSAFFNVAEGFHEHATTRFRHRARDGSSRVVEATLGKLRDAGEGSVVFSLRPAAGPPVMVIEPPPRDRFLAMLSHELRTPLMPVLLGVDALAEDERFAEARSTLAMMRRNLELQSRLLEELSEFTAVGQHKVRLRPESIDAHEAIRFVLENCRSEIAAARIEVLLDFRASENVVLADSVRLQQVMWNVVRNAVKFSTPGGGISITSANEAPGSLTLKFTDQGIGIEPGLLPLVFEAFQQGDGSILQRFGGLGLGMFIAKGLAEAQGGTLTVASEGRGKGATFSLTLKLARAPAMANAEVAPGPPAEQRQPQEAIL